jgi:hypothetical protein
MKVKIKHPFPVFLLIIPVGAFVILLALILTLNLDRIVSALESLFLGANRKNSPVLFYIAVALVPVISGTLMGLAVIILSKKEDEEYQRRWEESRTGPSFYEELARYFDAIDASIVKLRATSDEIKHQAGTVEDLGRYFAAESDTAGIRAEEPEIYSLTSGDSEITNIRIIHPVEGLTPQEPALFPQSHQTAWFFPHK